MLRRVSILHPIRYGSNASHKSLTIGNVSVDILNAKNPDFVPAFYGISRQPPKELLSHMRWLIQKDRLQQDVFLIGVPGKIRLELVLRYLEVTNREFEYLSITRDTTEADIKQRREIRDGTAFYSDLCAVRAALNGRVLVIDGVERAERNVLPILNNLLENREMQLDDGRFLMKHDKYDALRKKYDDVAMKKMGIERVSEHFHVIALGLPVPRFAGNSLDPPFRSRFQCRNVQELGFESFLEEAKGIAPNVDREELQDLVSLVYAFNSEANSSRPRIANRVVEKTLEIWNRNPNLSAAEVLDFTYPAKEILSGNEKELMELFKSKFTLKSAESRSKETAQSSVQNSTWIPTASQEALISNLKLALASGDFALVGSKGCGKSRIIRELLSLQRLESPTMVLHQDMSTRELVQRRQMTEKGDTVWEDSLLVDAARKGTVCVLDGVDSVHPSVLSALTQLVFHRRFDLPSGNRLIGEEEFERIMERDQVDENEMNNRGAYRIPKSFRIILLGESQSKDRKWINENILSLVPIFTVPEMSKSEQMELISKIANGKNTDAVEKLIGFVENLKISNDSGTKNVSTSLSLRRLIHIAKRDEMQPGHLKGLVEKAALAKFLPQITRDTFYAELEKCGIQNDILVQNDNSKNYLESIRFPTVRPEDEPLIPNVVFHENEQHTEILEDMARDLTLRSHLLLIGNQGVGKNKLTDRFLNLINRPRQYMQLHRDTTVQTLTTQTVVEKGIIRHEDSALVKAARNGQILVIDEADKAPLHVIAVLKSLLDTGTLVLGDGRTLRPAGTESSHREGRVVEIDPQFRIIMLANRPGFPFLGNNLFGVLGDLFAIHMIDHPARESELEMIKKYGPKVADTILHQLLNVFNELRQKTDQGLLQYPYSTRELVNIVRHCNEFPSDPLPEVCRNVFDFDSFNEDTIATIQEVFQKNGIPLGIDSNSTFVRLSERIPLGELRNLGTWQMTTFYLPEGYGFSSKEEIQLQSGLNISKTTLKLTKESNRNAVFSEQFAVLKLPIQEENLISDAIRVKDDLMLASVNPPKLLCCKQFMNSDSVEETDLREFIRNAKHPNIKLAHIGDNRILVHEETTNSTVIVDRKNCTASILRTPESDRWRLSSQKGEEAVTYQLDGQEIRVYTNGLFVQTAKLPFKIKRVFATGPRNWVIVSQNNEMFVLKLENDWRIEKIANDVQNGLDVVGAKVEKNEVVLVADQFYFLKGLDSPDKRNTLVGIPRRPLEKPFHRRSFRQTIENSEYNSTSRDIAFLEDSLIRAIPGYLTPKNLVDKNVEPHKCLGFLETIDVENNLLSYVPVPSDDRISLYRDWTSSIAQSSFLLVPWNESQVLTVNCSGIIRSFELSQSSLIESFNQWKNMTSDSYSDSLRMEFDRKPEDVDFSKLDDPKPGKIDPNNTPHQGGNQWMGGTGGYNTAGLGGIGGPFRLDAGHDVHQMPEFAKKRVPEHILKKAREVADVEYAKKLKEINMSEHEASAYEDIWKKVKTSSRKLASVVDQLEAKKKEREWTKHHTSGDLDDGKLIEGVTGEQNIYRRRVEKVPDPGAPQTKPKRLKLCLDVSGSMYRFNGYDQRLVKVLETALMTMTALDGKTDKVQYDIVGHSGDSPSVPFVKTGQYPKNDKERLTTLKRMLAHTQYCVSGDNTVESLQTAIKELSVKREEFDETIVILVSDANLERYGIHPEELRIEMLKDPSINSFIVFIGSLRNEADVLQKELPVGRAFVLKDTSDLPKIIETIFSSTIVC